tara:strand:- start:24 stop:332 length:309 start_codon:yes stop_codon:yes gene_type:complete
MGKTAISWIELMNVLIKERKSEGKPAGVSDVIQEGKQVWKEIKSGKHPKYIQGKPPKRKNKTRKNKKLSKKARKTRTKELKEIMKSCKMCKCCENKLKKCFA